MSKTEMLHEIQACCGVMMTDITRDSRRIAAGLVHVTIHSDMLKDTLSRTIRWAERFCTNKRHTEVT